MFCFWGSSDLAPVARVPLTRELTDRMAARIKRGSRRATQPPLDASFVITVRVKPRSSVSAIEAEAPGVWVARLRASPIDGKANAELIALVAKHFGCARSFVSVISGIKARRKLVRISGTSITATNGASKPFVTPER